MNPQFLGPWGLQGPLFQGLCHVLAIVLRLESVTSEVGPSHLVTPRKSGLKTFLVDDERQAYLSILDAGQNRLFGGPTPLFN